MNGRGLAILLAAGSVTACEVNGEYEAPTMALPAQFSTGEQASAGQTETREWWRAFNDSRFDGLVAQGLSGNLNIQIAAERMNAAAAIARGAGVAVTGGLDARGGRRGGSDDDPEEGFATGTVSVAWLLDFFGRLEGERDLAGANLAAAGFGVEEARLAFLTQLAGAYIDARFAQEALEITRQTLASRRETFSLTEQLFDAAAATVFDVARARGLVEETLADLPPLNTQFRIAAHRVSTLLGQPAGTHVAFLSRGAPQPYPRRVFASGVPADLLRNRPDVRAAERGLAAAVARTGIAKADLYPSISLGGRITGEIDEVDESNTWSFGPIVTFPIFGRVALNATVSAREAQAREQLLFWKNTVLNAVEEVENALVAMRQDRAEIAALQRTVDTREESLSLAQNAYSSGELSLLDVLDAERLVGDARIALAQATRRYALDFVALNAAVGAGRGTWQVAGG